MKYYTLVLCIIFFSTLLLKKKENVPDSLSDIMLLWMMASNLKTLLSTPKTLVTTEDNRLFLKKPNQFFFLFTQSYSDRKAERGKKILNNICPFETMV